jgi:hypothetical protein
LYGNDRGIQIIEATEGPLQQKTFDKKHEIFTGVLKIHEGDTIARPKCNPLPKGVNEIARSSANQPCIMWFDDNKNGRIVVDTGYTKLFRENYRLTAGTDRYFVNAVCWLGKTY